MISQSKIIGLKKGSSPIENYTYTQPHERSSADRAIELVESLELRNGKPPNELNKTMTDLCSSVFLMFEEIDCPSLKEASQLQQLATYKVDQSQMPLGVHLCKFLQTNFELQPITFQRMIIFLSPIPINIKMELFKYYYFHSKPELSDQFAELEKQAKDADQTERAPLSVQVGIYLLGTKIIPVTTRDSLRMYAIIGRKPNVDLGKKPDPHKIYKSRKKASPSYFLDFARDRTGEPEGFLKRLKIVKSKQGITSHIWTLKG